MTHWTFKQTEASLYRWISPPFLQDQSAAPDNKQVITNWFVSSAQWGNLSSASISMNPWLADSFQQKETRRCSGLRFPLTRLSSATSSTLTGPPQQILTISQTGSGAPASWDASLRATSSYHGRQSCCSHFLFIPPWISIASNATLIQSCKHICRKTCATEWEMDVLPSFTIGWNTQTNGNDV